MELELRNKRPTRRSAPMGIGGAIYGISTKDDDMFANKMYLVGLT